MPLPERHVLVCTGSHCRKRGSKKLCKVFKEALDHHGLKRRVKVLPVDCFDQCSHGPMAVIYPDATWYAGLEPDDAKTVVEQHLLGGTPVTEKLYRRAHGK
jgi:(2Fe-2S) ferredoxin